MPNNIPYASESPFWYGKTLCHNGKSLYLYDHRDSIREWKGAVTIHANVIVRANVAGHDFEDVKALEDGFPPKSAIIHITNNPTTIYTADDEGLIVLRVSTQASAPNGNQVLHAPANIVQFAMQNREAYRSKEPWLGEFLKLNFETAKKIAVLTDRANAAEFETDFSHFLDIILPRRIENRLAFRLLCEAKKACGQGKQGDFKGITIYAPSELDDWLMPFAPPEGFPKDNTSDQNIAVVASMIGSGEVLTKAKAVLKAVEFENVCSKSANMTLEFMDGLDAAVAEVVKARNSVTNAIDAFIDFRENTLV